MSKITYSEFEEFFDSLTVSAQRVLNRASLIALKVLALDLQLNKSFEASRVYFSDYFIEEMECLDASYLIFCIMLLNISIWLGIGRTDRAIIKSLIKRSPHDRRSQFLKVVIWR
jgi:hypothetical protein